ncbi:hypothetical protein PM082_004072 [Marasmius tenuissimus]|nr:hypothetical protein PM082_004072 [Marasmius tenuissimus]
MDDQSTQTRERFIEYFTPLFYGCLVGIGCFGVCLAQTWTYIKSNNDGRPLRAIVALLFLLIVVITVLNGEVLRFYLLLNFGNYNVISKPAQVVTTLALLNYIVTFVSDLCFVSRIWCLRRVHWLLVGLIILTALASLVAGAVLGDEIISKPLLTALSDTRHKVVISLTNSMAAASQALITFCLWYSFKVHMDEAPNTLQPTIFQRLSFIVLIRGTFLTIAQVVLMVLYHLRSDRLWWTPIHQTQAALYYITAITTFNICNTGTPGNGEDLEKASTKLSHQSKHSSRLTTAKASTLAGTDSLLSCFSNDKQHASPVSNASMLSQRQTSAHGEDGGGDVKKSTPHQEEVRMIPTPPPESETPPVPASGHSDEDTGVSTEPESVPLGGVCPNKASSGTSNSKQEKKRQKIGGPRARIDLARGNQPQMTRQLPRVPKPCAGR